MKNAARVPIIKELSDAVVVVAVAPAAIVVVASHGTRTHTHTHTNKHTQTLHFRTHKHCSFFFVNMSCCSRCCCHGCAPVCVFLRVSLTHSYIRKRTSHRREITWVVYMLGYWCRLPVQKERCDSRLRRWCGATPRLPFVRSDAKGNQLQCLRCVGSRSRGLLAWGWWDKTQPKNTHTHTHALAVKQVAQLFATTDVTANSANQPKKKNTKTVTG